MNLLGHDGYDDGRSTRSERSVRTESLGLPECAILYRRKADMPTSRLTPEIIAAAVVGFEEQKARIVAQVAELRAMLPGGSSEPAVTPEALTRKRKISA